MCYLDKLAWVEWQRQNFAEESFEPDTVGRPYDNNNINNDNNNKNNKNNSYTEGAA